MSVEKINNKSFTPYFFSEIFPDDILINIFLHIFKDASSYQRSNFNNICLVSKKIKVLFTKSYFYFLSLDFIKIPLIQSIFDQNFSILERGKRLNNFIKISRSSTICHKMIVDIFFSHRAYNLSHLEFFLKCGINPNTFDSKGCSLLMRVLLYTVESKSEKEESWELLNRVAKLLLNFGADANGSTNKSTLLCIVRQTPYSEPIKKLQLELISLLCEKGANPKFLYMSTYDTKPISPLDYAQKHYPAAYAVMKKYIPKKKLFYF